MTFVRNPMFHSDSFIFVKMRVYSGGKAASVSLRIFFCLRQKCCINAAATCGGKILAFEPEALSQPHLHQCKKTTPQGGLLRWWR